MKAIPYRQYAQTEPATKAQPLVTVIIPFLNEADVLSVCQQRVCDALSQLHQHCEILYIDDGSQDDSWALVNTFNHPLHQIRC